MITLSSTALENSTSITGNRPVAIEENPPSRGAGWDAAKVLAPALIATVALATHGFLPNRQSSPTSGAYPGLLGFFLAASIAISLLQWKWARLRPWSFQFCPLFAGAIFWLCIWDVITLKMAWMPLPYFPGPDVVLQGMLEDRALLFESTWHSLLLLLSGLSLGVVARVDLRRFDRLVPPAPLLGHARAASPGADPGDRVRPAGDGPVRRLRSPRARR